MKIPGTALMTVAGRLTKDHTRRTYSIGIFPLFVPVGTEKGMEARWNTCISLKELTNGQGPGTRHPAKHFI
jgi:hypothetical protein